ncbi:hypothetical protein EDB85DRAFT_2281318 [Lactarius pseudohatsudake]|nr:hypothetical protein EDB85DRAFT_2281318 [Lactarius pseudohatsudake]
MQRQSFSVSDLDVTPPPLIAPPDDDANNDIRYGRIPQRIPHRNKTFKRVGLFHGNFVIDSAVPTKLLNLCARKGECEFTHMRYSTLHASPCALQPTALEKQFGVMAMYNEDDTLFARTMHGVMKNIVSKQARSQQDLGKGRFGGGRRLHRQGWPPEDQFAHAGHHQGSIAINMVNGKPVSVHIVAVAEPNKIEDAEREIILVQIIFCLKEKNQKKINSYHWMRPGPGSIYDLWKGFDINSNVGGACVAAQNFEYKMSNTLDKPWISVWVHYHASGTTPVERHGADADIFNAMAEDRSP